MRGCVVLTFLALASLFAELELDLGSLQKPAPIPERWLLKLVPDKLPELPAEAIEGEWHERTFVFGGIGCGSRPSGFRDVRYWFTPGKRGFVGLAKTEHAEPTWAGHHVARREARLAVDGMFVEIGGELYTARAVTDLEKGRQVRELLLNTTLELPGPAWYRAGITDGEIVEEWRADFADDPRKKDAGKVTIHHRWRTWNDPGGKTTVVKANFKKVRYVSPYTNSPEEYSKDWRQLDLTPEGDIKIDWIPKL